MCQDTLTTDLLCIKNYSQIYLQIMTTTIKSPIPLFHQPIYALLIESFWLLTELWYYWYYRELIRRLHYLVESCTLRRFFFCVLLVQFQFLSNLKFHLLSCLKKNMSLFYTQATLYKLISKAKRNLLLVLY